MIGVGLSCLAEPLIVLSLKARSKKKKVQCFKVADVRQVENRNKTPWYITTEEETKEEGKHRAPHFTRAELIQLLDRNAPMSTPRRRTTRSTRSASSHSNYNISDPVSNISDPVSNASDLLQNAQVRERDLRDEHKRLSGDIKKNQTVSKNLKNQLDRETKETKAQEKTILITEKCNSGLREKIEKLSAEKVKLQSQSKVAKQKNTRMNNKANLDSVKNNMEEELNAAQDDAVKVKHAKDVRSLRDAMAEASRTHEAEVNEASRKHEAEVEETSRKHQAEVEAALDTMKYIHQLETVNAQLSNVTSELKKEQSRAETVDTTSQKKKKKLMANITQLKEDVVKASKKVRHEDRMAKKAIEQAQKEAAAQITQQNEAHLKQYTLAADKERTERAEQNRETHERTKKEGTERAEQNRKADERAKKLEDTHKKQMKEMEAEVRDGRMTAMEKTLLNRFEVMQATLG
jgi:hypothetical protein